MAKKNTLGRGLDSLFSENDTPDTNSVRNIRLTDIEPNPNQPRKAFDEEAIASLADSIKNHGLLQPIAVREAGGGFYQIIAGERRWRAAKLAGLNALPAIVYETDDRKAAELALIENLQREDLNPIEEAMAFRSLMNDFGLTQEEASVQVGKSRPAVANALRLLDLPDTVIAMVADGSLSAGHARAVLSLDTIADREPFAQRIVSASLSVRQAEAEAKRINEARQAEKAAPVPDASALHARTQTESYLRSLEHRVTETLGHRFRILDGGDGKPKKIEISYTESEELEGLLKRLCGEDFFEKGT